MKSKIIFSMLLTLSSQAFANIDFNATINLSRCKQGDKIVNTGINETVKISSTLLTEGLILEKSNSTLDKFGGYDGDPVNYSCSYWSYFGNKLITTEASINGVKVFSEQRNINLTSYDKGEDAKPESICNNPSPFPFSTSIQIVPTTAGQIFIKRAHYSVLINFSNRLDGNITDTASQNMFELTNVKNDINFTIGKREIKNSDDLKFIECQVN